MPDGTSFEFRGKTYSLPAVTQDDRRDFAAMAGARALESVRQLAKFQDPKQSGADYDAALQMVMAGQFGWEEPAGIAYRYTRDGMARLCWLCMRRREPATPLEDVLAMAGLDGGEFLHRHYQVANANPTDPSPSPVAAG